MDRARARSVARIVIYVGIALLAWALYQAVRVYRGVPDAARVSGYAFIAAALGLLVIIPAGYALAMLAQVKEEV